MGAIRKTLSSNTENKEKLAEACDVNEIPANISLRWKMQILYCIDNDIALFSKLKREFPTLSDQFLGRRLKVL
ncbi:winged helix-turn-helix transcriptional regulator [Chryseobacterium sp. KACC 21268]|nr:winged helix-turn-helix transcriptional regulator [Chryseobacterium sp. KACC 21268]